MGMLQRFDYKLAGYIQSRPEAWRPVMAGVSFLGEPMVVLTIGFAGFISAAARHQTATEEAFFFGAIAYAINTILKLALHRRRPDNLNITMLGLRSYSFPSGHAFGTVIFYGLFSYLDYHYLNQPWNFLIAGLLWAFIFIIGVSRVYLKSHYPSDVVGGWALGLVSLLVIVKLSF
jgi:membrane-associated phospholipid phosphatase